MRRTRRDEIGQNVLADPLGCPIDARRLGAGGLLGDGQRGRLTIDGAGRGEDEVPGAELGHDLEQVHEAAQVVPVVEKRLLLGLPHSLGGGEMDHAIDRTRRFETC